MTRREYEMTPEQLQALKDAARPVSMSALHCGPPASPRENVNAAWAVMGRAMGFRPMTVRPVPDKDQRYFTAEPA